MLKHMHKPEVIWLLIILIDHWQNLLSTYYFVADVRSLQFGLLIPIFRYQLNQRRKQPKQRQGQTMLLGGKISWLQSMRIHRFTFSPYVCHHMTLSYRSLGNFKSKWSMQQYISILSDDCIKVSDLLCTRWICSQLILTQPTLLCSLIEVSAGFVWDKLIMLWLMQRNVKLFGRIGQRLTIVKVLLIVYWRLGAIFQKLLETNL